MTKTVHIGSIKIEIDETPGHVAYRLSGIVDESFKHQDVPRIKAQTIIMDLEGLSNFNSCGVREWVYLVKDLDKLGQLRFTKCSIAMVDQLNMVPESIGNGIVDSFFAPFACEEHGEVEHLLDVSKDAFDLESHNPPAKACSTCHKPLIFDAMPDSYFLFLTPKKNKKAS
jgi:anti-anti-sigma regulatory factor